MIAEFADKILLLEEGKITKSGKPQEVFPDLVDIQKDIGVRVPQVTEFASKVPNKFSGSTPVTLNEAIESYKK